ncbi:MAG TPA: hypothetical protein VL379_10265 [Pseudomonadales bacterium]|nr:hypothetical protein [Pseudomonadales bacterium]
MKALFGALSLLLIALPVVASDASAPTPIYLQAWVGALDTDSDSWKVSDPQSGEQALGDLGTLPYGGGAGQQLWGSGAWQVGYEGGGLVTWKNGRTEFRGNSNAVLVRIDNTFGAVGVFMGGVLSVRPFHPMRLYVAAGPSITGAWLFGDDNNEQVSSPGTTVTLNLDDTKSDVSVVPYARAGIEFELDNGFTFGVSARYADDEFDFGDAGKLEFDQVTWMLTLGGRV